MDNKTLTDTVSRRSGIGKKDTAAMMDALAAVLTRTASDMDTVAVPGFGSFEPKKRAERVMSVPSTGKRMLIPPKITLSFKPAALLKQQLREDSNT